MIENAQSSPANSVGSCYLKLKKQLSGEGIESAAIDARMLISSACDLTYEQFVCQPGRKLNEYELQRLGELVRRRCMREPVSKIIGHREFWSLPFRVSHNTLDPRPETECLVSLALDTIRAESPDTDNLRILDLGTGSGCILLSLLSELPGATGIGSDISDSALDIARFNSKELGFENRSEFIRSNWFSDIADKFNVIISNPPYICREDLLELEADVRDFDPEIALDGGLDGLDSYRRFIPEVGNHIQNGGWLFLEIGAGQLEGIEQLLELNGFVTVSKISDLAQIWRCVAAKMRF